MTQNIKEALAFVPPPVEDVAKADRLMKWYFDPVFEGLEHISPDRPTLLVGNHSRFAGLDKALLNGGVIPPIPRGIGMSMLPRPEKFYFKIGKPIETRQYNGRHEDKKLLQRLQRKTADTIYDMHKDSMLQREHEAGEQPLWRRLLRSL